VKLVCIKFGVVKSAQKGGNPEIRRFRKISVNKLCRHWQRVELRTATELIDYRLDYLWKTFQAATNIRFSDTTFQELAWVVGFNRLSNAGDFFDGDYATLAKAAQAQSQCRRLVQSIREPRPKGINDCILYSWVNKPGVSTWVQANDSVAKIDLSSGCGGRDGNE